MADSVKSKDSEEISESIIIRKDQPVKINRGEGGKFKKQAKTMPKTQDLTRLFRNLLNQAEAGPDGLMRRGDKSRNRKLFDNIVKIALADPFQVVLDKQGRVVLKEDGTPYTFFDSKAGMTSVQAFKELYMRSHGQPGKSDEELDALKTGGVKFVVIAPPSDMMNKEVIEDKPKEALKPAFIEGEFSENK